MQRRTLLRSQLIRAWHETIKDKYAERLINSERGLQVYFCESLLRQFDQADLRRRLFVEPCIRATGSGKQCYYSDVVICNSKQIIGVVELKYLPRAAPKFAKDLATLNFLAAHAGSLTISNDRYRGAGNADRQYPLAADAVLCWAGVYKDKKATLPQQQIEPLGKRFLQLDAVTCKGKPPAVFSG